MNDGYPKRLDNLREVELFELYCMACGRFLLKYAIDSGIVQVKCRCKTWNTLDIGREKDYGIFVKGREDREGHT